MRILSNEVLTELYRYADFLAREYGVDAKKYAEKARKRLEDGTVRNLVEAKGVMFEEVEDEAMEA